MVPDQTFDPIQVEVWRHLLAAVAEAMGATLQRTAYSPNIKERLDYSCALFDSQGALLAQAAHIPVHLGAMPLMLRTLLDTVDWQPGTMWLCNDPRHGGTHLPDITLVSAIYLTGERSDERIGFVASRAHHADIGGLSPGSLPLSREAFQEGLILPPIALVERGQIRADVLALICANSRTPAERRGDLAAQISANETGAKRMLDLVARYGLDLFRQRSTENISYAAQRVRRALLELPFGDYHATDLLESDGAGETNIPISLRLRIDHDGRIVFDFTGSAPQVAGSLNATEAITRSACYYVVRCLVPDEIPTNAGCFEPIDVVAPEGSVVNARFPAAVAGGNVETSQRIVDVALRALGQAAPPRMPAASQGTMNNLTIGGFDPFRQRAFAYYETIGGGVGASASGAGASAIHSHMTNTRNTPIEVLESHYPLQALEYSIAQETGGVGLMNGGNGIVRRIKLLTDAQITLITERRVLAPYGVMGGLQGRSGSNRLGSMGDHDEELPSKWSGRCPAESVLRIQTPGGGGWGECEASPVGSECAR